MVRIINSKQRTKQSPKSVQYLLSSWPANDKLALLNLSVQNSLLALLVVFSFPEFQQEAPWLDLAARMVFVLDLYLFFLLI